MTIQWRNPHGTDEKMAERQLVAVYVSRVYLYACVSFSVVQERSQLYLKAEKNKQISIECRVIGATKAKTYFNSHFESSGNI